jgi:hypothetical protein
LASRRQRWVENDRQWKYCDCAPNNGPDGTSRHCAFKPTTDPESRWPYATCAPTMSSRLRAAAVLQPVWLMTELGSSNGVSCIPSLVRCVQSCGLPSGASTCSCMNPST